MHPTTSPSRIFSRALAAASYSPSGAREQAAPLMPGVPVDLPVGVGGRGLHPVRRP